MSSLSSLFFMVKVPVVFCVPSKNLGFSRLGLLAQVAPPERALMQRPDLSCMLHRAGGTGP